ncbi:hypothetical protein JYK14_24445 [Siccirubricoccus sp. KC 17139]|uniref:Uncharacterized protein n=1 Tax=Siccirubricoccus soli TaxID=2899147 RepID=A0ABT1DBG8_9PROT|nr:hypothetical protein [Siccirubricoccus soli]MCO6419285.1 hypothetical protein [Siccirubricoccus soli]MCP2685420.1 hypothetical protein [Siccirubricoccus soli]
MHDQPLPADLGARVEVRCLRLQADRLRRRSDRLTTELDRAWRSMRLAEETGDGESYDRWRSRWNEIADRARRLDPWRLAGDCDAIVALLVARHDAAS